MPAPIQSKEFQEQFFHACGEMRRYCDTRNETAFADKVTTEVAMFRAQGKNILEYDLLENWNPDKHEVSIRWVKREKIRKYLAQAKE